MVEINQSNIFYEEFPDKIESPNYGDKWGRIANYIEINNRAIAQMQGDKCKNGILSSIKILPLIPPSPKSFANSVILSQIFPNIFGDGYNKAPNEENSIYGIKLGVGYSQNIIDFDILDKLLVSNIKKIVQTYYDKAIIYLVDSYNWNLISEKSAYNNDAYIKIEIWNMEENKWEHKAIRLTSAKNFIEFNLDRKFDVFASNCNYESKENYLN